GPRPAEVRVDAEPTRVGSRVASFALVLAAAEHACVDPAAGRRGAVGLQVAGLADELPGLELGAGNVDLRAPADLAQQVLRLEVGPPGLLEDLVLRVVAVVH